MASLAKQLSDIVGGAFESLGLPADLGLVRVSDRPDLCQFQCNGAMAAAKQAKKNPREVAQGIVDALADNANITKLEIAGPGFINIDISDDFIAAHIKVITGDARHGVVAGGKGETIVLDYGGMNVAKAMHVGHLRSLAIGSCLKNMLRFDGYNALGDIHMGDWGLQMGQIISEFELRNPEWPYFDESITGPYPETPPFAYSELEAIYPLASQACKDDPDRLARAQQVTAELQAGRAGYVALWRHFMSLSIADIKKNIAPFNVEFDIWKGESSVNDLIPEITKDLEAKGVVEESNGAIIIHVAREDDKQEIPPLMYLNSRGAQTYGTTDMGTIYDRIKTYPDIKQIIYETDIRQSLHFEQLFRACEKAGYLEGVAVKHIGHGTINGADGKPFKTRSGGTMKFADMLESAIEKATNRLDEAALAADVDAAERADIAEKVAIAALKYTELSNQAHVDYVFDLERMTSFEGKTGPYLLYQAVRIKSLLKKATGLGFTLSDAFIIQDTDRTLALLLAEFPDHFENALRHSTPHVLCDYAYKLAQAFSSFYSNCHMLSEEDEALRASRLGLCSLTVKQLELVLGLLGIELPERM